MGDCDPSWSSEECACNLLGICGGGGEPDPEVCNNELDDLVSSMQYVAEATIVTTTSEGSTTRSKDYDWVIARGVYNTGLTFTSHETGTHKKVSNEWRWDDLVHKSISREGTIIGGSVTAETSSATKELGLYYAGLALKVNFTFTLVCQGFPISTGVTKNYQRYFNVND